MLCEMLENRREAADACSYWHASQAPGAADRLAEFKRLLAEIDAEIEEMTRRLLAQHDENPGEQ